jgi:hypothetical protein
MLLYCKLHVNSCSMLRLAINLILICDNYKAAYVTPLLKNLDLNPTDGRISLSVMPRCAVP